MIGCLGVFLQSLLCVATSIHVPPLFYFLMFYYIIIFGRGRYRKNNIEIMTTKCTGILVADSFCPADITGPARHHGPAVRLKAIADLCILEYRRKLYVWR